MSATGFLAGGGRATELILARDWSSHPLGPPEGWPDGLCTALSLVLNSPESMILCWGADLHFFFNEAYFPLLGPRLPWAMGARFDQVWADGLVQAQPIIDAALAGHSPRYVDLPWKLATDRGAEDTWWSFSYSRILDRHGAVAGLFIFTNETTARVVGDAALARSQAELATAIEDLRALNRTLEARVRERTAERNVLATIFEETDSFVHVIDPDYRWLAVNRAGADEFARVFGRRPAVGACMLDMLHDQPGQQAAVKAIWSRALAGEEFTAVATFGEESRIAEQRSYELKFNTLRDDAGRMIGAFQVGTDVTARLRAAAELEETREALRQSQKMEAVGQLTGGLAHDFNNLLAAVIGGLELLQLRVQQGRHDQIDRYVAMARTGADRAAALTQRLLAFSRRQTLAPTVLCVNELVAGMREIVDRTMGPAIMLDVAAADGLWAVRVDAPQLENALLNLCINARDAMPDGGRLTIETANRRLDAPAAAEHDLPPGDYVSLSVTDTGIGMPPELIQRVFEPFFTTKPIGEGTGLGLSMIYGFTRQSGGQVRIRSTVGGGTTVSLYLPRHDGPDDRPKARTPDPVSSRAPDGATVLLVEDEAAVRQLMADTLSDAGYRILTAADGPAGVAILRSDARIDLLVTDVGLPGGLNGRQVADAGRAVRPGLAVLFVTGYAANAAVGAGHMDAGMAVLTKPFAMSEFARKVRSAIAE